MARRVVFNDWTEYVLTVIEPGERQVDIARRTGIDQTTVSRWLNGESKAITPPSVRKFAIAYRRPVLEAFVVAGFLTSGEARLRQSDVIDWKSVDSEVLLRELQRRLVPAKN